MARGAAPWHEPARGSWAAALRRSRVAAIFVVVLAGLWLRGSSIAGRGLWLDEYATAVLARGGNPVEVWRRCQGEARGPIYFATVAATTGALGESELSLRLPSLLASCLVPLVVFAALRRGSLRGAAAAAALIAIHPELVWHGQEARSYAQGELATALALLSLVRVVEHGRALDRLVLWACVIVALDAHPTFAPLLPAVALAPLVVPPTERAYPWRNLWRDGLVAGLLLALSAARATPWYHNRGFFTWASESLWKLPAIAFTPEGTGVVLAGLAFVLALAWRARRQPGGVPRAGLPAGARVGLAFCGLGLAASFGEAVVLSLLGSPITVGRYLPVAIVTGQALVGLAAARLPRALGAAALALVAVGIVARQPDRRNWSTAMEWREAQDQLAALEPAPGEPVLLWTGFADADLAAVPGAFSSVARATQEAPIVLAPGKPDRPRRIFVLPATWPSPGSRLARYFEDELVPLLESAPRFFVVAHPDCAANLEAWFARRLPHRRLRCSFRSREFNGPVVVERWESGG